MITGKVTAEREAIVRLEVTGPSGQAHEVEAVVDTGFLTLSSRLVRVLNLPMVGNSRAMFGDGSTAVLDLYLATVLWNAQAREVLA